MSSSRLYRWNGHTLVEIDDSDPTAYSLDAADSLLVSDGRAFAIDLHRQRFGQAIDTVTRGRCGMESLDFDAMWESGLALIPAHGHWFPRFELRSKDGESHLAFRRRPAPTLTRAVTLLTHAGADPRTKPSVKGPDIDALLDIQKSAKLRGADDIVVLTTDGDIIDGGTNALMWWREDTLCAPITESDNSAFARVPSITAAALLGLAAALGVETRTESATPADLNGCEVWALNALHGIRMVTRWIDGPQLAERPGRISAWRERREALRIAIGGLTK